ncbi:MAG TPA: HAD-IA family hydrolase [Candidatus Bathyarchaeia archaeon]|nr:HAD-IA family hydrolase [Candidatus Bathyarchaeia archaeon]
MGRNRDYEVITFDCYGTLIDWETGIRAAFKRTLKNLGLTPSEESDLSNIYQEEEKRIEARKPYKSYRKVLAEAFNSAAKGMGKTIPEGTSDLLAEQLPTWRPFTDTNSALEKLARYYKLGILSNIDDDLLKGTLKHFRVPFDIVVTAEHVRSYKPGTKHFLEARKRIGPNRGWLHVAASLYHDVEPATRLNINTVWVNRKNSTEGKKYSRTLVSEVKNLNQLADLLES